MFFIPGILITIATFPGVIVHEIAHLLFCRIFRVAVFEVCYFRFGNPSGYVVHERPRNPIHHIMIGIGPFILNSVVGAVIAAPGVIPVIKFEAGSGLDYFLVWLGVSIAMHAFPSTGDAKSIWQATWSGEAPILAKLVTVPIVALIYVGAVGSFVWLDLIYGVGISMLLPVLLVRALA